MFYVLVWNCIIQSVPHLDTMCSRYDPFVGDQSCATFVLELTTFILTERHLPRPLSVTGNIAAYNQGEQRIIRKIRYNLRIHYWGGWWFCSYFSRYKTTQFTRHCVAFWSLFLTYVVLFSVNRFVLKKSVHHPTYNLSLPYKLSTTNLTVMRIGVESIKRSSSSFSCGDVIVIER